MVFFQKDTIWYRQSVKFGSTNISNNLWRNSLKFHNKSDNENNFLLVFWKWIFITYLMEFQKDPYKLSIVQSNTKTNTHSSL